MGTRNNGLRADDEDLNSCSPDTLTCRGSGNLQIYRMRSNR
jgi:hypothetical protein